MTEDRKRKERLIIGGVPMATEKIEMMRHRRDWHWGVASPVWACGGQCVRGYAQCLQAGGCLRSDEAERATAA